MVISVVTDELMSNGPPSPVPGLTLSWHNLSVWVTKKNTDKSNWFKTTYYHSKILRKVNGVAEPGSLMAIMGPSGSGKTTLLATISQRLKGDVKGKILVNGQVISKEVMMRISGFLPQQDLTFDTLTVYEHLQLMARLKLSSNMSVQQRNERIYALVTELGIIKCKHTKIKALSGGERRRVSLAVEMLTDPALLFCDEPTTGLDSYSAFSVIEQLRQLAARGKVVICTIHQPASGIFDMFQSVYLLVSGGKLALTCPVTDVAPFFQSIGMTCPATYNIAEFVVSKLAQQEDAESQMRLYKICNEFKLSVHYERLLKRLENELNYAKQTTPPITSSDFIPTYDSICQPADDFKKYTTMRRPSKLTQLGWLLWRSFLDSARNPQGSLIRLAFYLFLGLLISTPYVGLKVDQEGIQNLQGLLYLIIVETTFTFTYRVSHTFPAEIPILLREVNNGLYTPGPYYISKMLFLLPRALIEPMIYTALVFWIAGLFGGFTGFLIFCVPVIMSSIAATAYGCVISAVFEDVSTGSLVSVPYEQFCLLFCGIFMSLNDVPFHFAWVKYISIFFYGLEAVSILQWSQIDRIPCSDNPEAPCIASGAEVLDNYGYYKNGFYFDIGGLVAIYIACHVIGFLAFWKRSQKQAAY
ncbi:protein scarlet [Halyomorpha halys]|uniref:protein scarlet n=1 Tax=Halyomorpha halys TaxID=286706 RepID=UPI0006D5218A|nr:protein scarlet [Halyomorpha halys]XP_014279357.1 protein scarlet [Halyomorpha halys]